MVQMIWSGCESEEDAEGESQPSGTKQVSNYDKDFFHVPKLIPFARFPDSYKPSRRFGCSFRVNFVVL